MSLTFYYAPMSTASVTSLVLAELDIPHERVRVDITKGGTKTPEFLKLNPNGRVPVIVHDGTVIFESCAISMSSYQHLQAWAGRCAERPGYEKLMAEMQA